MNQSSRSRLKACGRVLSTLLLCGVLASSAVLPAQALDSGDDVSETQESQETTQTADEQSGSDASADVAESEESTEVTDDSTTDEKSEESGETEDEAVEPSDENSDKGDTDSSAQQKPVSSRATSFDFCSPQDVYALSGYQTPGSDASILQVNLTTRATTKVGSFGTIPTTAGQANAMGITSDGGTAYALFSDSGSPATLTVREFSAATGDASTVATRTTNLGHSIIAGAVNPVDDVYWVGGRESAGSNYWRFSAYEPGSNQLVNQFRMNLGHDAGQGDLLFDPQGNMYILATNGSGSATAANQNLWVIPAASIATAVENSSPTVLVQGAKKVVRLSEATRTYHSVAWGADGYIYAASSANGNGGVQRTLHRINPVTGTDTPLGNMSGTYQSYITDFASCANPNTLTLQKEIVDRADSADQFALRITGSGIPSDSEAAYGETSGDAKGVQDDAAAIAGPIPALPGGTYSFTETGIGGTSLAHYDSTYVCVNESDTEVASGTGTTFDYTVPASANGTAVTCTFTNKPKPAEPIGTCEPSQLLGVTQNGRVWSVEESDGATAAVGSWASVYNSWTPSYASPESPVKIGVNGLARASDGTMYAYARGYVARSDLGQNYNLRIRLMVKEPGGTWKLWSGGSSNGTFPYSYEVTNAPVAGAIDPKTGHYVWGGFQSGYFVIREIDLTTGKSYVTGRVSVGASAVNGDIAFDEAGNLYIVGQGGGKLYVTTVTAADLAANRTEGGGYNSWPSKITPGKTVSSNYSSEVNGIAVGEHGDLYVSTTRYIYQVNPLSGALVLQGPAAENPHYTGSGASQQSGFNTDMASCASNSPTTLTVQKDLRDGGESNDQFTLSVAHEGNEVASATAQTRVSGSTILAEKTGPTWVQTGSELELTETGANLAAYDSSLNCVIDGTGAPVNVTGAGTTTGSITVPEAAGGKNITCTFTNTPVVEGEVDWSKTDSDGNRLQGSVWTLTGPSGSDSTTVTVKDCVASTAAGCADQIDKDHRAGYFTVTALPAGAYTLTEKQAPAGYLLSDEVHHFDIGTDSGQTLEADLGPIVNYLRPALVIPLTGGLGTDLFLILGGILVALLIAGALYRRYSMRRASPGSDAIAA
ncbi:prealbumin-like fold domain-containing protein [Leucobacter tenebrionis]|uniref:prealbumin-like fold domain-containing protein n=1 Tax=Leucobacter tenebrionis TaxID=2873270 RepID=UPI001CA61DE1|nr:prealbumin-like fold domain-containing protein [Leucobacter tenebrionis]QZY52244.1 hypothetical protein KVY00_01875 [Leucobacter tenebrionis]